MAEVEILYTTDELVRSMVVGRRGQDRAETPDELDNDQILAAIASATSQINLSLERRYVVPFNSNGDYGVPPVIRDIATAIASYLALLTFRGANAVSSTDPLVIGYDRARRMLGDIQNNRVDVLGAISKIDTVVESGVFNDPALPDGPLFPVYPIFREGYIPPDKLYN